MMLTNHSLVIASVGAIFFLILISCDPAVGLRRPRQYATRCDNRLTRMARAETCFSNIMMFGNRNFTAPGTMDEADSFCKHMKTSIRCGRKFTSQCLEPFPRQIISAAIRGGISAANRICNSPEEKQEFLEAMKCARHEWGPGEGPMETGHKQMETAIVATEHIRDTMNYKDQLPAICCNLMFFRVYLADKTRRNCRPVTGSDVAVNVLERIISESLSEMMDLMCGKYDNLEICEQDQKPFMDYLRGINEQIDSGDRSIVSRNSKSILFPVLDVFIEASGE